MHAGERVARFCSRAERIPAARPARPTEVGPRIVGSYDARSDLPTTTAERPELRLAAWTSPNHKEGQCAPHHRGIWPPGWVAGVPHTGRQPRSVGSRV